MNRNHTITAHILCIHAYMCIHQVLLLFSGIKMHGRHFDSNLLHLYLTTRSYVEDAAA